MIDSSALIEQRRRRQQIEDREPIFPTEGHGFPPLMMIESTPQGKETQNDERRTEHDS